MKGRGLAGSASAAFELQRARAEEKFLEEIAAAFSEPDSNGPSTEACPRKDISHETIELSQPSSPSSSSSLKHGKSTIETGPLYSTLGKHSDTEQDLSANLESSRTPQLLITRKPEKLDFDNVQNEFQADEIWSSLKGGKFEPTEEEGISGYGWKTGYCTGFLHRALRSMKQSKRHASGIGSQASNRASRRKLSGQNSENAVAKVSNPMSIPVSLISQEAFSKAPSKDELKKEYELLRNPFPNVPEYRGNPPWLTRYHPDLVKPPARP